MTTAFACFRNLFHDICGRYKLKPTLTDEIWKAGDSNYIFLAAGDDAV